MKSILKNLGAVSFWLLTVAPLRAGVPAGIEVGGPVGIQDKINMNPAWPYWQERYPGTTQEPAVGQPMMVEQPLIQQPAALTPTPPAPNPIADPEENPMRRVVDFHARLARARIVLARELSLGNLTLEQYDRENQSLSEITDDEHQWALENNDSLSPEEFNHLRLRLDQIERQIQRDLTEE